MSPEERPRGLTGTVVRGVGFAGGGFLLARGITFASYIVLARLVTPTELGQFTAGTIIVAVGVLFAGSGMAAAVIHREDRLDEAASTAVAATVIAGVALSLIAWALAPLIGRFFEGSDTVAAVAAATAGALFLGSARVIPNALLQRRFSFLRRMVVDPAAALAFGLGAIIATSEGMGVWGLVVGLYASAAVDFVLSWGLVGWRPRLRQVSYAMWRDLIPYARHVLAGSIVRRLGNRIPIAAAGGFVGTAALGQFQYANRIVSTPFALLVSGVSYVVFPAFARISHDAKRFQLAFLRSMRWTMLLAAPIGMILFVLGEPLATLVFGERWREAGEATRALAAFVPAQMIAQMTGEAFKSTGVPPERTRANIIGVAAGVVAMAALIPPFGLIGVALGVSIDALASAVTSLRRANRVMGIRMRSMLDAVAPGLIATIPLLVVVLPLEMLVIDAADHGTATGLLLLGFEALLCAGLYAGALRVLAPDLGGELKTLIRAGRQRPKAEEERPASESGIAPAESPPSGA